jgi:hypothetical protein
MRLNPGHFNRFLNNIGQQFVWRRAYACSCATPESGAPSTKCPLCLGKGHIWVNPVQASAAAAGQKTQVAWAQMGLYEKGDMVMTVPENSPLWDAGQFDRVTMLNATDRFSQPLKRGAPTEKLMFTVKQIDRVFWIGPDQTLVEGGIPTVDANGRPTWKTGEPPPGMSYSISGTRLSEYFIYQDLPRNRNMHDGARLPKLTVLRRWDLLGR